MPVEGEFEDALRQSNNHYKKHSEYDNISRGSSFGKKRSFGNCPNLDPNKFSQIRVNHTPNELRTKSKLALRKDRLKSTFKIKENEFQEGMPLKEREKSKCIELPDPYTLNSNPTQQKKELNYCSRCGCCCPEKQKPNLTEPKNQSEIKSEKHQSSNQEKKLKISLGNKFKRNQKRRNSENSEEDEEDYDSAFEELFELVRDTMRDTIKKSFTDVLVKYFSCCFDKINLIGSQLEKTDSRLDKLHKDIKSRMSFYSRRSSEDMYTIRECIENSKSLALNDPNLRRRLSHSRSRLSRYKAYPDDLLSTSEDNLITAIRRKPTHQKMAVQNQLENNDKHHTLCCVNSFDDIDPSCEDVFINESGFQEKFAEALRKQRLIVHTPNKQNCQEKEINVQSEHIRQNSSN